MLEGKGGVRAGVIVWKETQVRKRPVLSLL